MKILIACEFSGIVREAFKECGHDAWSCDLLNTEIPGQHIIGDVADILNKKWDMMIAHPPCQYLSRSGSRWWSSRQLEQREALNFVQLLMNAPIDRIVIENPVGAISTAIRKPDQYIQPWQHGHGETKKTGLWLKNVPLLLPSNIVDGREERVHLLSPSPNRWKERSRTLPGIAKAMSEQWGVL